MIRIRIFLFLLWAGLGLHSMRAQTLWPGTTAGMSLEDVQRMFPAARVPEEPIGLPHGRGVELLQIPGWPAAGRTFTVHFFFKEKSLVQVSLTDTEIIASKDFESVRAVLRKRYNLEYSTTNTGEHVIVVWKIAQSTITLSWTPQGREIATLAISYEGPVVNDAERL